MFLLTRFLIPCQKKDSDPTTNSSGKRRSLAALVLSRVCCKIRGRGLSAEPRKILMLCGFGSDGENWKKAQEIRAGKRSKAWLMDSSSKDGENDDYGMDAFEQERVKGLEAIANLGTGDKAAWRALDSL
jgi:hypothetical protein